MPKKHRSKAAKPPATRTDRRNSRRQELGEVYRHIPITGPELQTIVNALGHNVATKTRRFRHELGQKLQKFFRGEPGDDLYVAAAVAGYHKDGEIEIDDNALVSRSTDGGAYVAAWVWVDNAEVPCQDPPTWQNTLQSNNDDDDWEQLLQAAAKLGYPYVLWAGDVYRVSDTMPVGYKVVNNVFVFTEKPQ